MNGVNLLGDIKLEFIREYTVLIINTSRNNFVLTAWDEKRQKIIMEM